MKKTCIKILSVVLCAVMVLGFAPLGGFVGLGLPQLFDFKAEAATDSGVWGGITWSFNTSTGVLDLSGKDTVYSPTGAWNKYSADVRTINVHEGIKSIGYSAFRNFVNLTTVNLPNTLDVIGNWAFGGCTNLTKITIPNNVKEIWGRAFYNCTKLSAISLPNSLEFIETDVFTNTAYFNNSSNWDNGVLYIGNYLIKAKTNISGSYSIKSGTVCASEEAFKGCNNLKTVVIPNGFRRISNSMFADCSSLTAVTIPNSVISIGYGAFLRCTYFSNISIPDSVSEIDSSAFYDTAYYNNSANWKNNLLYIGKHLIEAKNNITDCTIAEGTLTIAKNAFGLSNKLINLILPKSLKYMSTFCLGGCYNLLNITVDNNNNYFTTIDGVLFDKNLTTLIKYPPAKTNTTYSVPNGVQILGEDSFNYCSNLKEVILPDSLKTIADYAFSETANLALVHIPSSVTHIGERIFLAGEENFGDATPLICSGSENCQAKKYAEANGCNFTVCDGHSACTQQHVVDDYKKQNAEYAKKYIAGVAQPMDGSNGNPDLCIPGLSLDENMVPQGIAYYKAKNQLLISAYYNDGKNTTVPSAIFALDMATGKMVKEYRLYTTDKNKNEKAYTGHVGGIAVSDYNLYITSGSSIAYIPLSDFDGDDKLVIKDKADFSSYLGEAETSYLSINNGVLFTGNFYYSKDSRYNKPAKDAKSVIIMQSLGGGNSGQEWEEVCNPAVSAVVKVPDSIDRIQGVTFHDGKFYISSSFGRTNKSIFYITDMIGATLKIEYKYDALPMMEGITFVGDYIYAVHESASAFYLKGLDGKGESLNPTDVVWKIDYQELIDPYNLGDETYRFGNYADSDSDGHCFGMSITSAGYYTDNLFITAIGGNKKDGLYAVSKSDAVEKPICAFQKIQGSFSVNAIVAGGRYYKYDYYDIDSDWNEVVNYVKNHQYDGKGNLQIGFRINNKNGHAVNFLRYSVVNGQERIYAYDNNFPDTETYFYKDSNGDIRQAPVATFKDKKIECIALRDINKYFGGISSYNEKRYIYSKKDEVYVSGAKAYPIDCGDDSPEQVVFEIPANAELVAITPLTEDATFTYLDEEYSFETDGEIALLSVGEETEESSVEFTTDYLADFKIKQPSVTTVKYGDTLVLHADLGEAALPEGWSISWDVDGAGFTTKTEENGLKFNTTSSANGTSTVKATIVDENGDAVLNADGNEISAEITLKSNASFWQKIVSFFKNLFRINRIIY